MTRFLIGPFIRTHDLLGDGESIIFVGPDGMVLTHPEWEELKARADATYSRITEAAIAETNASVRPRPGGAR